MPNDRPVAPGHTASAVCGVALVVDPLAAATDANGGPLSLVPGSVCVPAGATADVGAGGVLRLTAGRGIAGHGDVAGRRRCRRRGDSDPGRHGVGLRTAAGDRRRPATAALYRPRPLARRPRRGARRRRRTHA
ncbi:MAG: hypothetical protein QM733_01420 [Ilumatobacteraceae bacterium]